VVLQEHRLFSPGRQTRGRLRTTRELLPEAARDEAGPFTAVSTVQGSTGTAVANRRGAVHLGRATRSIHGPIDGKTGACDRAQRAERPSTPRAVVIAARMPTVTRGKSISALRRRAHCPGTCRPARSWMQPPHVSRWRRVRQARGVRWHRWTRTSSRFGGSDAVRVPKRSRRRPSSGWPRRWFFVHNEQSPFGELSVCDRPGPLAAITRKPSPETSMRDPSPRSCGVAAGPPGGPHEWPGCDRGGSATPRRGCGGARGQ